MLLVIALTTLITAVAVGEIVYVLKFEPDFEQYMMLGVAGAFIITVLVTFILEILGGV